MLNASRGWSQCNTNTGVKRDCLLIVVFTSSKFGLSVETIKLCVLPSICSIERYNSDVNTRYVLCIVHPHVLVHIHQHDQHLHHGLFSLVISGCTFATYTDT